MVEGDSEQSSRGRGLDKDRMWLSNSQPSVASVEEVETVLQTSATRGLSPEEVQNRYASFGHNELIVGVEEPIWKKYLEQFKNPLIILLLCSAGVSLAMRQFDDAVSITVAIIIVVTVGFVQEYRSEKTLEKLKKLVPPVCLCLRNGRKETFEARYLVPGDLVFVETGDRVPADIRLVEAVDLSIDESSLTGEGEPSHKSSAALPKRENYVNSDLSNIAFMGTMVCAGHGAGLVVATGEKTQFGQVFLMMSEEESPQTPLQVSMNTLGKQLSAYSLVVIGLIMVAGWFQGRPILVMFNIGVSLAVAAIPEGLPIVTTVTLALGVMRMAKRRAIVKKLPTVEALGCVNVICSDKTGTITSNQMTAVSVVMPSGDRVQVTGNGYNSDGDCNILHSEDFAGAQKDLLKIAEISSICNNATIESGELRGQPTEGALLALANKISKTQFANSVTRIKEIPFSSETRTMTVMCQAVDNDSAPPVYYMKGAMKEVLSHCNTYLVGGKVNGLQGKDVEDNLSRSVSELGGQGLRVLALAYGTDLDNLTLAGLVGMKDPPREGVQDAIRTLKHSGVRTLMLTGDAQETAVAIGEQIGLTDGTRVVRNGSISGQDIDRMSESDLAMVVRSVNVYYRVSPRHKVRIVKALQAHGFIVAMTGDGVNDGVAVKCADVGISMGKTGTDVCKEASDVILLDDDFSTIMCAIEEGKSIFLNIRNFVRFQMSTSIAALSLITLSTLMDAPNPLNPMQILWINIIMDGPPAQSLGVEPPDKQIMKQPPRNTKVGMLTWDLLVNIILSAVIIVAGTMYVFKEMMEDGNMTKRDTTMTFTCFVFFDMFNALSCRSQTKSIFEVGFFTNRPFCLAVIFSLVGQMLVIYTPPLQYVFQTEALSIYDMLFLVALTSSIFIVSELKKFVERWMSGRGNRMNRTESAKTLISLV